jgi:organic hydroperoxide reductase OsmC/OhrA
MHPYPHTYRVSARGAATGEVTLASESLPDLGTTPPPEFDGPGGHWSPETLLCGALADCFVLTFRGVSRATRLDWKSLECRVEGTLERRDGVTQFTAYKTFATLTVAAGTDVAQAHALLERAEKACLISNSVRGTRTLSAEVLSV